MSILPQHEGKLSPGAASFFGSLPNELGWDMDSGQGEVVWECVKCGAKTDVGWRSREKCICQGGSEDGILGKVRANRKPKKD